MLANVRAGGTGHLDLLCQETTLTHYEDGLSFELLVPVDSQICGESKLKEESALWSHHVCCSSLSHGLYLLPSLICGPTTKTLAGP